MVSDKTNQLLAERSYYSSFEGLVHEIFKEYPQYKNINKCLETGTYLGWSAMQFSSIFNEVHTIEINEAFFEETKKNLQYLENIFFHLGDSVEVLSQLLQKLAYPMFFYLDAHSTNYNLDNKLLNTPILEELEIINKYHPYNDIILIDDTDLFGKNLYYKGDWEEETNYADWTNITVDSILNVFDKKNILHSKAISYYKGINPPHQYLILLDRG